MELVSILLVVSGLLVLTFAGRAWYRRMQHFQEERQWKCSGFDARRVASRLECLRDDYIAELRSRKCYRPFHESLLAAARQALARLSFFTRSRPDEVSDERESDPPKP